MSCASQESQSVSAQVLQHTVDMDSEWTSKLAWNVNHRPENWFKYLNISHNGSKNGDFKVIKETSKPKTGEFYLLLFKKKSQTTDPYMYNVADESV